MHHPTRRLTALALLALALAPGLASAQIAGGRAITIVVPFPPGGGPDLAARTIAERLAPRLGQPVVVDNKPGVGGLAGATFVARAKPDGSTLLLAPNTLAISPHVLPKGAVGIDVLKELVPVVEVGTTPMLLVAAPQAGIRDVAQMLAAGRKGELNYGTAGNGSPMHFAGVMLARTTGLKLVHIPYKGVTPSVAATMAGEVPLLFVPLGGVTGHVKSGKLVALAVAERRRTDLLPGVPTLAESGVKGVEVNAWYGLFAATGTPPDVLARINQELNEIVKLPEVRQKLEAAGIEPGGGTPQALGASVAEDYERYGRIARELRIQAD
ncbi:MAG TPA: tripartite tricarboxylate transporter substrate binding protein [Ramlibacter sp.]|jgi:tripartite-type tricarboxylate transporter receptor subunit TctC|nr:tripartite tricarboxylate transporter substrate binding protein [Ramlibacter sp.]